MATKEPREITEAYGFVGGNLLKGLLEKEPAALTEVEMDILRARQSYLTEEELEKYGIGEDKVEEEKEEEKEEEEGRGRGRGRGRNKTS